MATAAANGDNVERRCENPDCLVGDLVSRIPKRKTPQFIVNPSIIEKPLLVNNFNSVFQVDGASAKISDINSNMTQGPNSEPNTIYRIIPNTHAHIVNYVVVDDDGEALRKLNSSDPTTISKLLKSQVASAQKMLHKLMTEQGTMVNVSYNNKSGTGASTAAATTAASTIPKPAAAAAATISNENVTFNNSPNLKTYVAKNTVLELPLSAAAATAEASALPVAKNSVSSLAVPNKSTTTYKQPISLNSGGKTTLTPIIPTTTTTAAQAAIATASLTSFRLNSQIQVTRKVMPKPTPPAAASTATILPMNNNSTTTPLIKTVPLSQLQKPSVLQNRPFTTTIKPVGRQVLSKSLKTSAMIRNSTVISPTTPLSSSSSSSTISATSPLEFPLPKTTTTTIPTAPTDQPEDT